MTENRSLQLRESVQVLLHNIDNARQQFAEYLPPGASVQRFIALAKRQVALIPALAECSTRSVLSAIGNAAASGLPIDGQFSSLIVRRSKNGPPTASWDPTYRGMISLALASGEVTDVQSFAVTEHDEFNVQFGTDPRIDHRPALLRTGRLVAAYAYARLKSGRLVIEVLGRPDLDQIKRASPAGEKGPWGHWEAQMARKSAIRRLLKKLPAAPVGLLSDEANVPDLIDEETGELLAGAAPAHLSDEDVAAGFDSIENAEAGAVDQDWLDAYDNA